MTDDGRWIRKVEDRKRLAMGVGSVASDSSDSPRPSYLRAAVIL